MNRHISNPPSVDINDESFAIKKSNELIKCIRVKLDTVRIATNLQELLKCQHLAQAKCCLTASQSLGCTVFRLLAQLHPLSL